MHWNVCEYPGERMRALVHASGLRVSSSSAGLRQVITGDIAIDLGDRGALVGIGDHHPPPVLLVTRRRCLHGQRQTVEDDIALDGTHEIEPAAHRTGR